MNLFKEYSITIVLLLISQVWGHGRMILPPARNMLWRHGHDVPENHNDTAVYCGGLKKQWSSNVAGRCGECGDPWEEDRPRDHETGGKYAKNIIVGRYKVGKDIDVTIDLTSNHLGWFQFSLCPRNDKEDKETNECFDKHILELSDGSGTIFHIPTNKSELQFTRVKLPENVSCNYCVIRWHWFSGNRIGPCDDGEERLGCGPQETYRNCADIAIEW